MQRMMDEAGIPEGVYQNIFAHHGQISAFIAHPVMQGVSLTGSERAGAAIAEQTGRHLKKAVLELGGSDPYVILSTDDVKAAAQQAFAVRMENTGYQQTPPRNSTTPMRRCHRRKRLTP